MLSQWLAATFIKNHQNTQETSVRTAYGKMSSIIGIACNVLLSAAKFLAGMLSGSLSITADAANNLSDASSSVISLFGFRMASKPADSEHPYGHARYEYLSALMVALLIMLVGVELLRESIGKILSPTPVEFSWLAMAVLVFSIWLKLWMAGFNRHTGRLIGSETLIATAQDSRNDVITTSAVLVAALVSHFAHINLDGWMGLGVAAFILYSGFGLVRETLDPLLGRAPDAQVVNDIEQRILAYPGVLGTHDLMLHDYGPGRRFGSVHVEMAAEGDAMANHDVIDNIERDFLQADGLHLIVHLDPIVTSEAAIGDLRQWLLEQVKQIHPDLSIHDLRLVPGPTHTNVIFDCVVPHDLHLKPFEIKAAINRIVNSRYPNYYCVITLDNSYHAMPHQA